MRGQIGVQVEVPPSSAPLTAVPTTRPATTSIAVPQSAPPAGSLPFTGFDLTAAVGVAAILMAVGAWLSRVTRRRKDTPCVAASSL